MPGTRAVIGAFEIKRARDSCPRELWSPDGPNQNEAQQNRAWATAIADVAGDLSKMADDYANNRADAWQLLANCTLAKAALLALLQGVRG
jgi:hypothetical protein